MKKESTLTIEDVFSELETDLRELGGNWFKEKRLPNDVDGMQLAEKWGLDISSARRKARILVRTGKWNWIRVSDPRCPQGLMVLRRAENGRKETNGEKPKRR